MVLLAMIRIDDVAERQFAEQFFAENKGKPVGLKQFRTAYAEAVKKPPIFRVDPIEIWNSEKLWDIYVPICVERGLVSPYDM